MYSISMQMLKSEKSSSLQKSDRFWKRVKFIAQIFFNKVITEGNSNKIKFYFFLSENHIFSTVFAESRILKKEFSLCLI